MSETDKIFENEDSFNKEDWIKQKQENRAAAFKMLDEATAELSNPESFMQYLDVQSRFDRYSVSNALLVSYQMPEATRLGDSAFWQKNGVYIEKGERGITILEPGKEFARTDGSTGVNYNAKKVFDISQTNAERKQTHPKKYLYRIIVNALVKTSPVPIDIRRDFPEHMPAVYKNEQKKIFIRPGMTADNIFRALAKEIAFAKLDKGDFNREEFELKAYGISFIVCSRFGIAPPTLDKNENLFGDKDAKAVRQELSKIRDEANSIALSMEKTIEAKTKNKDAR